MNEEEVSWTIERSPPLSPLCLLSPRAPASCPSYPFSGNLTKTHSFPFVANCFHRLIKTAAVLLSSRFRCETSRQKFNSPVFPRREEQGERIGETNKWRRGEKEGGRRRSPQTVQTTTVNTS